MTLLLIILAVIVVLGLIINAQPNEFKVSRSMRMNAAPARVFEEVNDLHHWQAWSPWAKLDPDAKYGFDGPAAGEGASHSWDGNKKIGAGKMTIVESRPGQLVRLRLEFFKPFKNTIGGEFTFVPEGTGTLVTWEMKGPANFMSKAMGLVMDCSKMVGEQYDKGLRAMKAIVETK